MSDREDIEEALIPLPLPPIMGKGESESPTLVSGAPTSRALGAITPDSPSPIIGGRGRGKRASDQEESSPFRVDILTIFPDMVRNAANCSIIGRAISSGRLDLRVHDLRDWAIDKHRHTDDTPFGGGAGMVMLPGPLLDAIDALREGEPDVPVLLMTPDGERFDQAMARELAGTRRFVMVCGHYEGLDERVRERAITRDVSIGDFVLTGGELPALVILDATARLQAGVLGNAESAADESFGDGTAEVLLEYPHYTRPAEIRGMRVPEVLLSGHHAKITAWRRQQALAKTRERRPDLWEKLLPLGKADQKLIDAYDAEKDADRESG